MTRKQKRLTVIAGGMSFILVAVLLVMFAFSQSVAYFYMPGDLAKTPVAPGTRIRLGGLVKPGTLQRGDNLAVRFEVTDGNRAIAVSYQGILPDLFREGQGVIAEGTLEAGGGFKADSVLAKHDEKYMPKEVVDALKKQGRWEESAGKAK